MKPYGDYAQLLKSPCLECEDTVGYLRVLRAMVDEHGVPLSLYRDRHSAFQRNDNHWTEEEQLAGQQAPTQLGQVLEDLGIEQIAALTAQAKAYASHCTSWVDRKSTCVDGNRLE